MILQVLQESWITAAKQGKAEGCYFCWLEFHVAARLQRCSLISSLQPFVSLGFTVHVKSEEDTHEPLFTFKSIVFIIYFSKI